MDLVVKAARRPIKGETIIGDSFSTVCGGKGANQAVAAARLGGSVTILSCVGSDSFGKEILGNCERNNIDISRVRVIEGADSGVAVITIAESDNSIIVVKGANDYITPQYVESNRDVISTSAIVVLQHEVPLETIEYTIELCHSLGFAVLLNPAPAMPLTQDIIEKVTYLTPNEHEAEIIFGAAQTQSALEEYPNKLFITEGENGVRYFDGSQTILVPAGQVEVVDTTGAGDTFNGAFALALVEGKSIAEALHFGNKAASLSVTGFGAQGGMPRREELEGTV